MFSAFFRSLKQEFAGYNSKKLLADMMAGLTVCAVALPLALAFGVSSGASAAAGLVTAIIAGVVIAILGGASYQISGPTGAMSAVLVGIVAEYGLQGVFFACLAAGVLLLAGVFKLGRLISFIPMPVIMGFTSGIAIIIAMGQIDNFFGTVSEGDSNLEKIASYGRLGFHPNMQAVLIGLLVVLVMVFWPKKWGARVPGSLVGIILATIVATVAGMDQLAVVGDIPKTLLLADRLSLGGLSFTMLENMISPIVTIAALGMIESLLCGASASRMKGEAFNADQELIAQGVGNILLPLFWRRARDRSHRTHERSGQVRPADAPYERVPFAVPACLDVPARRRDGAPAALGARGCADGHGMAHERLGGYSLRLPPQVQVRHQSVPCHDGCDGRF